MYNFKNQTVLITGASSGLGERFARVFSRQGARLILCARRTQKINALAQELGNAQAIEMDVTSKTLVEQVFLNLKNERIEVCINNAGLAKKVPIFEDDSDAIFEQVVKTNLYGVWYVSQYCAKHMKDHKLSGSIINIASVNGDRVPASNGGGAYSASKAAVIQLTRSLVGELSKYGIRMNSISPGYFHTPMTEEYIDSIAQKIPGGKVAKPSDLDGLIMFLASNDASQYVQGSNFTIDGGISSFRV